MGAKASSADSTSRQPENGECADSATAAPEMMEPQPGANGVRVPDMGMFAGELSAASEEVQEVLPDGNVIPPSAAVTDRGSELPEVDVIVEAQLEQMGFDRQRVRAAIIRIGESASVEDVLQELLSSHPSGAQKLATETVLTVGDGSDAEIHPPPSKRPRRAPSRMLRRMSVQSQQVLERVTSRHAGVSHAAVARLLLRATAALRQELLSQEQREQLHQHLEQGHIDLVHEVITGVGVQTEPAMPLDAEEAAWECRVCFTEQEEQGWKCPHGHRYCSECMRQHVDSVPFPRCPTSGCGHEFAEDDLRLLQVSDERIAAFSKAKLQGAVDALGSAAAREHPATGSGSAQAGGSGAGGKTSAGETLMRCPNSACGNAVLVSERARRRYVCGCGLEPFCTSCRVSPYHYHALCSDVQPLRQRWLEWISGGRAEYHGKAEKSDSYEKQMQALQEGLSRHSELEADEQWKAKHCRLCPSCSRPVQKLAGCSSMVCGADAHGGNQQPGCGQNFEWTAAQHYTPRVESRALPAITAEDVRCRGRDALHAFVDCSLCGSAGQGIVGPRFRCIHCEGFDVCIQCEAHLSELHPVDHVFEVMFESDFDWSSLSLPRGTRVRLVRRGDVLPVNLDNPTATLRLEGLCGVIGRSPQKRSDITVADAYQWQTDRGRWVDYAPAVNLAIATAARNGLARVQIRAAGSNYMVDLVRMRQRNIDTGVGSRAVRAAPLAAPARGGTGADQPSNHTVILDAGQGKARVARTYLQPIVGSRAEMENLMEKSFAREGRGDSPSPPPSPVDAEDEEEEDEEAE